MGIVLNTRLSAKDNVASAANKAHRMLNYLKRSFVARTPKIFLSLDKTPSGHIVNILIKLPIPS